MDCKQVYGFSTVNFTGVAIEWLRNFAAIWVQKVKGPRTSSRTV